MKKVRTQMLRRENTQLKNCSQFFNINSGVNGSVVQRYRLENIWLFSLLAIYIQLLA